MKTVMEVFFMLEKNLKSQNNGDFDWRTIYKKSTCEKVGINPDLPLIISGQAPEPQYSWNDKHKKYDGSVNGYAYIASQNVVDEHGKKWFQNPVAIVIEGATPKEFKFGDKVKFEGLGAYYSRRKYCYQFRAEGIYKA